MFSSQSILFVIRKSTLSASPTFQKCPREFKQVYALCKANHLVLEVLDLLTAFADIRHRVDADLKVNLCPVFGDPLV